MLQQSRDPGPSFSWVLVVFFWLSVLCLIASFILLIVGNVWVFGSRTCKQTSAAFVPVR